MKKTKRLNEETNINNAKLKQANKQTSKENISETEQTNKQTNK